MTSCRISAAEAPRNGLTPVAASYNTHPSENWSERGSSSSPRAYSGDMYDGVALGLCYLRTKSQEALHE